MKICYKDRNFNPAAEQHIKTANEIIEEYAGKGFELTLRQLYYQFVSRDILPNTERSYKNLGNLINDARMAGLIDWEAIVDRTRYLRGYTTYADPREALQSAASRYKIDVWKGQQFRVEVWVEKDALVDVISSAASPFRVDFFSCRGYTSASELWSAARRLAHYVRHHRQRPIVIHLGDHDPSGIDMTRDIGERLTLLSGETVMPGTVHRIALNMDQIDQYNPPPNPAKLTDSRSGDYVSKFGDMSWELDALEPTLMRDLIQSEIKKYLDQDKFDASLLRESEQAESIRNATLE
jgi:hypothetical protein